MSLPYEAREALDYTGGELLEEVFNSNVACRATQFARNIAAVEQRCVGAAKLIAVMRSEPKALQLSKVQIDSLLDGISVTIQREDLVKLRLLVGQLKVYSKYARGCDKVEVSVRPVAKDFEDFMFNYVKPYNNNGKCRIVERQVSHTDYSLVCASE